MEGKVYIFEFKVVDAPTGAALRQIKAHQYFEKYMGCGDIYIVGIEFGKTEKNLVHFEWEEVGKG